MSLNAHHCWGVFTSNKDKAYATFDQIETEYPATIIKRSMFRNERTTLFSDGVSLVWVRPEGMVRGYRYHKLWLDSDVADKEILESFVFAKLYMDKDDIIYI